MEERENYLVFEVGEEEAEVVPPHRLHGDIGLPATMPVSAWPLGLAVLATTINVVRPVARSTAAR